MNKITRQEAADLDCDEDDLQRMGFTVPREDGWEKPEDAPERISVPVKTKPVQTNAGPAWDFAKAVQDELGTYQCGTLYAFGETFVRFFEHEKQLGADFFRPCKPCAALMFSVTRVTSTGKRRNMGYCYL